MKLTLHIGLPKAASTTLQAMLSGQRENLRQTGTLVPRIGYRPDPTADGEQSPGHDLVALLAASPRRMRMLLEGFVAEASAADCQRIFISSENLTHPHNLDQLESAVTGLHAGCAALALDLQFLLIDREDAHWARSYYNELVLDGRSLEIRPWLQFQADLMDNDISASGIKSYCGTLMGDQLAVTPKLDIGVSNVMAEIARLSGANLDLDDVPSHRTSPNDKEVEAARLHNLSVRRAPFAHGLKTGARSLLANIPEHNRHRIRHAYRSVLARTVAIR